MRHKKVKVCTKCGEPAELVKHRTICRPCNLARKRAVTARKLSTEAGAVYNRKIATAYRQTSRGRAGLLLWHATKRAKDNDLECTLDVINLTARIAKGFCEVTGLPFDLKPGSFRHHANPWAPSLDRKNSSKGYTPDNVQVVVAAYNYAKSEWSSNVLLTLARAIVDANRKM